MPALIEIQNCSVIREDQLALSQISLTIKQNESVAILGPNGSGKSSLLKLISRELYPLVKENSFVRILGEEHFDIRNYRSHLGVLSFDLQQLYDKNVPGLEVVISGFFDSNSLWQHFEIKESQIIRAKEVMSSLSIENLEDRLFGKLSTGQQRRLLLARALVHAPKTLILDEPTTGLDMSASFRYSDTLRTLINSGTSIVLVTHHLYEIPPEIERVIFIRQGQIVGDDLKQNMLTEENLSNLFETPICLTLTNGYYQAHPKSRS